MKNKRKIIIIMLIIIVAVGLIGFSLCRKESNNKKISKAGNIIEESSGIKENLIVENTENIAEENQVEEEIQSIENPTNESEESNVKAQETSKEVVAKSQVSDIKPVEQVQTKVDATPEQTQVIQSTQEPIQKAEEPKVAEIPKQDKPVQTEPVEKYVRNDSMINKIKGIIESNVTDDMKNFGYNIVVDSSIKNQTNQFTFTQSRVISNIKYSFGTIKIYAEDYYNNGNLIMTQCYIL